MRIGYMLLKMLASSQRVDALVDDGAKARRVKRLRGDDSGRYFEERECLEPDQFCSMI